MRLVYLNGDPGVPLFGSKGASVHVREMLRALAPHAERLVAVTLRRGAPGDAAGGRTAPALPCDILALDDERPGAAGRERDAAATRIEEAAPPVGPGASPAGLRSETDGLLANHALEAALDRLHAERGVDAIYERYSLWSFAGARFARRHGLPWVLEVNAPLAFEAERHRGLVLTGLAHRLAEGGMREAAHIFTVSRELREYAIACGAPPDRVSVLPNACDTALFRPAPQEPAAAEGGGGLFRIGFVGSLKPWHGLEMLADAFAALHEEDERYRLLVVGYGPQGEALRARLLARVPPHAFTLTGRLAHDEVPARLALCDAAVAPYPAMEGFYFSPMKVFEYCAMGIPVVASRIGQIEELLADGETALLTPPGDAAALAAALRRLREDAALRRRLGRAARRWAETRTWECNALQVARRLAALSSAKVGVQ